MPHHCHCSFLWTGSREDVLCDIVDDGKSLEMLWMCSVDVAPAFQLLA